MKPVATVVLLILLLLLVSLSACSVFQPPDNSGTVVAQNNAVVLEATAIRGTAEANRTRVARTAVYAETHVMEQNSINEQLLLTAQFGNPPTRQMIVVNAGTPIGTIPPPREFAPPTSESGSGSTPIPVVGATPPSAADPSGQFVDTVTTSQIRNEDGCPNGAQSQFGMDTQQIYVVTRAVQVSAGTEMAVEWRLDGQTVDSNSYTVPNDESDFCIYFYIDSFSPGNWTVQLSANGTPITPAPSFTVVAGGT